MIYASPGLEERRPDINYAGVLKDEPENEWKEDLDQILTKGNVFFSEAIFYHKMSRTLLVGDLIENLNQTTSSKMFLFKLFGAREKPMASPEFRMYTTNEKTARQALEQVQKWEFERIFLCHGDIIESNAKSIFNDVCSEFLEGVKNKGRLSIKLSELCAKYQ